MLVKWTEWTGEWTRVRGSVSWVPCHLLVEITEFFLSGQRPLCSSCPTWSFCYHFSHLILHTLPCPFISQAPPASSKCLAPTAITIFFYPLSALDDWLLTSSSYPTPKHLYLLLNTHKRKDTRLSGLPAFQLPLTLWRVQDLDQVSYVFDPALSSRHQSSLYGSSSTWKDKDSRRETWLWILAPCFFCLKNNSVFIYLFFENFI